MADNMCGPSNAAKGLVSHADRDRSHHQDRVIGAQPQGNNSFRTQPAPYISAQSAFDAFQRGHDVAASTAAALGRMNLNENRPMGAPEPASLFGPASFSVADYNPGFAGPHAGTSGFDATNYHEFISASRSPVYSPGLQYLSGSSSTGRLPVTTNGGMTGAYYTPDPSAYSPRQYARYDFGGVDFSQENPYFAEGPVHNPYASNVGPVFPEVGNVGPAVRAEPTNKEATTTAFDAAFSEYDGAVTNDQIDTLFPDHESQQGHVIKSPTAEEMTIIDANLEDMAEELEARRAASDPAVLPQRGPEAEARRTRQGQEDLVRAASGILSSVSDNQSEKFRKSSFLDLMRRIQKMEIVVSGTDLVEAQTGKIIITKEQVNGEEPRQVKGTKYQPASVVDGSPES